jgi:predicted nucleic acid-binding protein
MIFVDSNIPMYVIGSDEALKAAAVAALAAAITADERLVTDAEVLQEILHRYTAIRRSEAIQPAFDVLLDAVDEVLPIEVADVQAAKEVLLGRFRLSARDAVHVAVMRRRGIDTVISFDRGFDGYPGIHRRS